MYYIHYVCTHIFNNLTNQTQLPLVSVLEVTAGTSYVLHCLVGILVIWSPVETEGVVGITALDVITFLLGQTIIMKARGPNTHTRTAKALNWIAKDTSATWSSVPKIPNKKRNASHIRPNENVENAMYLDSLKFWGNRIVKMASALLVIIKAV